MRQSCARTSPNYSARVTTYTLRSASPAKTRADAVIIGVATTPRGLIAAAGGEDVSEAWGRKFRPLLQSLGFSGKAGEVAKIPTAGVINSPLLVVVGLGDRKSTRLNPSH